MKKTKAYLYATASLLLAFVALSPATVAAFSAYGAGTSGNPYRVATCAQLQEINNNLAGHYKLVSDIDCTGTTFTTISSPFTGTLDGQNHTIAHIAITGSGLFAETNGATIKNLKLASGTISGTAQVGSFVSNASSTTLTNVHSSMTIVGTSTNGGLVGLSNNDLSIGSSSYSGSITSTTYSGGLVGLIYDTGTNLINDSFFNGTLTLVQRTFPSVQPSFVNGGLVGLMYGGTISNSYSSGTINHDASANTSGGIVGLTYDGVFNNSFSATTIIGTSPDDIGAIFGGFYTGGSYSSTRSNLHFDRYLANTADCAGFDQGSGNCTARNTSNATPDYFKNSSTNGPLSTWNFTSVWATTNSYPTLRDLASFAAVAVPNDGDANGDGTADSYQARVTSVPNADDVWSTIEIPTSGGCTLDNPQWLNASSLKADSGFTQQLTTFTSFDIYCPTAGMTVPVTIIYDKLYDTSNSILRHYNPTTNSYITVSGAVFSTRTVGGIVKTTVTYSITDGDAYDTDGTSNGIIKDPVGFSIPPSANTGLGSQSNTPILALMILGALFIATGVYGQKRNR